MNPCDSHPTISGGNITYSTIPVPGLDATTVATKVNDDLQFKGFVSGTGIIVDEITNPGAITITATGASQAYTYSTEVVPGVTSTVVGTQVGANFGFRPIAGLGDVTVDNASVPGALAIQSNVTFSTNPVLGLDATVVDTKVGSDLRFRGFVAGTNVTLDQVSVPGAIVISASGGSPSGQLFQNNTLFVDAQFGNDVSGTRERRDLPYQTIAGALADAILGDQIHIFPGNYVETNTIPFSLSIHAEDGVTLSAAGAQIFTIGAAQPFSMTGKAVMNVSSGKTGFVLNANSNIPIVQLKQMFINNGIGFNISGNFVANLTTDIDELNITGGTYVQSATVIATNLSIVSRVRQTNINGVIYNGNGVLGDFSFDSDYINSINNGQMVVFSGTTGRIFLNGKSLDFGGSIAAQNVRYFNIEDTTTTSAKSEVFFSARFDNIFVSAGCPFLIVQSNKPNGLNGMYPVGQIVSHQAIYQPAGFNGTMFTGTNGDIILRSHDLSVGLSSNNTGFFVKGSLTIDCSGTFLQTNTTNIMDMMNADQLYLRANDMYLSGPITSANGNILADTLACDSLCQFVGMINIDAKVSSFTNSSTGISVNPGSGGRVNITGQSITFTASNGSSPCINALSSKVFIKAASLVFVNTANSSTLVSLSGVSHASINADHIENMSVSATQSNVDISCLEYVWTPAGGSNVGLRCTANSTATFTGGLISLIGSPNWVSNSNSVVMVRASKLVVSSTGTVFAPTGSGVVPTDLVLDIEQVQLSPSSPGLKFVDNVQSNVIGTFGELSATNNNVSNIFTSSGVANTKVEIGYSEIPCPLYACTTGSSVIHCQKCITFSNNPLISIAGNGVNEISGNYTTTTGSNAVLLTSLTQVTTIGPSKLYSLTNSISGPAGLAISVVPSVASTPAAGVTINGLLVVAPVTP